MFSCLSLMLCNIFVENHTDFQHKHLRPTGKHWEWWREDNLEFFYSIMSTLSTSLCQKILMSYRNNCIMQQEFKNKSFVLFPSKTSLQQT